MRRTSQSVAVGLVTLALSLTGCGYNEIQQNEEAVFKAWADVEATYPRRADRTIERQTGNRYCG